MNPVSKVMTTAYYLAVGSVMRVTGHSPRAAKSLSVLLGTLRYHVGYVGRRRSRRIYLEHMRAALPDRSEKELRRILMSFWRNHQRCFLELFLIPRLQADDVHEWVEFLGTEHLDEALGAGRGVVLAVPHYGNERFLHIALAMRGYPVSVLSAPYDDMPRIAADLRLNASARFHHVGTTGHDLRWLYERLAQNGIVQIAPTGEGGARGVPVELLGQRIEFASGPARLARRTGAAFVPALISRGPDDRYLIEVLPRIQCADSEKDPVAALTRAFARLLDERVRLQPEPFNWMWWVIRRQEDEHARR
jgi:phosphatidylinositol dimannoside acyltransferase